MTALRKSETRKLIASLEAQGCRVEWATVGNRGNGRIGRFPVKVFPPDKSKGHILLHDTVSSPNDVTVKRTEVMRAGLTWPFDDKKATKALEKYSRKEQEMTSTDAVVQAVQAGEPMQHVKVPPAVTNRTTPPREEVIKRFVPYLADLPATFWTSELVDRLQAADVQGYRGNAGNQRTIEMLDWLGYRVVEYKPNRSGYSYRWVKDPNAIVKPGVTREERAAKLSKSLQKARRAKTTDSAVTPIRANGEPVREVSTSVGAALQDAIANAEKTVSAELGQPVQFDQTPLLAGERRLHHDRKQCVTCNRWFTPEGYDRHIADTQHGAEAGAVPLGNDEKPKLLLEMDESHKLRMVADAESLPGRVDVVPKTDYDALEAMALENERKLAEAHQDADELRQELRRMNLLASEQRKTLDAEQDTNERLTAHLSEDEIAALMAGAHVGTGAADGSWLLEDDVLDGDMTLIELAANARRMGVTLEIRVRRA